MKLMSLEAKVQSSWGWHPMRVHGLVIIHGKGDKEPAEYKKTRWETRDRKKPDFLKTCTMPVV